MVRDLGIFLDIAEAHNIFVIITLFNGALIRNDRYRNLITDDARLTSYINNALIVNYLTKKRFGKFLVNSHLYFSQWLRP